MRCYHCAVIDYEPWRISHQIEEAVGICQACGEAVCKRHAVKSDLPLPGTTVAAGSALLPLLCADCYSEVAAAKAAITSR